MYATIIETIPTIPATTESIRADILARDALGRELQREVFAHAIESENAGTGQGIHYVKFMYDDGTIKTFDGRHWS